jgi:hypothetical protein
VGPADEADALLDECEEKKNNCSDLILSRPHPLIELTRPTASRPGAAD